MNGLPVPPKINTKTIYQGWQLDALCSFITVLHEIVTAVSRRTEVLVDSDVES